MWCSSMWQWGCACVGADGQLGSMMGGCGGTQGCGASRDNSQQKLRETGKKKSHVAYLCGMR